MGVLTNAFLIATGLLVVYGLQLAETNEYMGYRTFSVDWSYLCSSFVAVLATGMFMPTRIRRPSDFFSLLYGVFTLLPYATLFPIRSPLVFQDFALSFATLAVPLITIRIATMSIPPLRLPWLISQRPLIWLFVSLCVTGVVLALLNPPASAGFDLTTSYERRIEGRSIFSFGTPSAYLNSAIVNGFAPFLAFVAGSHRKVVLIAFSLFCGLAYFFLLGLKAPLLFITLAVLIGYAASVNRIHLAAKMIYTLVLAVLALFLVEYIIFDFSLIGDYLVRRAFSVPPYLVSAYFDFMTSSAIPSWSLLGGVHATGSIAFVVGEAFLGVPGLNANTNAFIFQLAAGGAPMYALTILFVGFIFVLLDATYACRRNPALLFLGFSYAILLTEQAATTALVSSGIGFLIMLVIFSGSGCQSHRFSTAAGRTCGRTMVVHHP